MLDHFIPLKEKERPTFTGKANGSYGHLSDAERTAPIMIRNSISLRWNEITEDYCFLQLMV